MEQKINSVKFKKHLLLSYIYTMKNCKTFDNFIKLISTTEEDCHKLIIELMNDRYIIYQNDGYELNKELLKDYKFFMFNNKTNTINLLKNQNKNAIVYLPKSFLKK